MNHTPDPDLVEDLAGLLPAPDAPDLPQRAHALHKERLMRQIDQDRRTAPRPARPLLRRPALLLPAGLAAAGALTAALVLGGAPAPGAGAPEAASAPAGPPPAGTVLDRASTVALATDAVRVTDASYVYVRSMVRGADLAGGKAVVGPLHQRESWQSQRPGPVQRLGYLRENGELLPVNAELGDTEGTAPGVNRPTYRWLAALPRDPRALLEKLRELTPAQPGEDRDQAVFERIGALAGVQVMPPETAAALYRAAALIPGVRSTPDASDATGRHGLGIVRDDPRAGERSEWVFDEQYAFLGSRTYLTRDTAAGPAGTLMAAEAVQQRGVVATAGDRPH
ncbi:hypothetical protein C6N75_06100 [Streptomyces solincola]|uniref:CU044_5270 family protein n=1 Tax=Streptomyces solincola TaxID=2100817 RepID=A0A2S9Q0H0_9ACTN|nr:CU044_5270 family protein [Streptomyces solincola]PRH80103.1 hypothetical protein C6N75_06100 [Streptomyces solincola]